MTTLSTSSVLPNGSFVTAAPPKGTLHVVKSWPSQFGAIKGGLKSFDIRDASDRDFKVGDVLWLHEWDPDTETYTGRDLRMRITFIVSDENPCPSFGDAVNKGFVVLSLVPDARPQTYVSPSPFGPAIGGAVRSMTNGDFPG